MVTIISLMGKFVVQTNTTESAICFTCFVTALYGNKDRLLYQPQDTSVFPTRHSKYHSYNIEVAYCTHKVKYSNESNAYCTHKVKCSYESNAGTQYLCSSNAQDLNNNLMVVSRRLKYM